MRLRIVWLFVVLGLISSNVWAIGHLGPPTAELKQGQWSLGFNYAYSTQDLDNTTATLTSVLYPDGLPPIISPTEEHVFKTRDLKTSRYYGRLGYGLADWWEVYGQLGLADIKGETREEDDDVWDSFNSDTDFAWGWGTKVTFSKQYKVDWGLAVQMNWLDHSSSESYTFTDVNYSEMGKYTVNIDAWELVIAVGPTFDMDGWKLYGGPFYYMLDGDYNVKDKGTYDDDGETGSYIDKYKGDLEEDSSFGGYVGAQFELSDNCDMTIEYSATGDGWGVGGGIAVKF